MKFYSAVEINGSAYVKVTTTNFLNISSSGLFYNFQNLYGDNYLNFYNNGLYMNNSYSTGFNTFIVGNNQMNYYSYSSLGTGQFTATSTYFTANISNGGNVSITTGGTEINDFSTSGNLNLTSANAVRIKTGSYYAALQTANLTALRTYQLPNADGAIALTSDIPNVAVTWGTNTSGSMYTGYHGNSVLYNTVDTPSGNTGFAWNAAQNNTSGIYSAQMFIGIPGGTAITLDDFWWRTNQQGGAGWPGNWIQVASRVWVSSQNYISTETDPVYTAAIPSILMYKSSITTGANLNTFIVTGFYAASNTVSGTVTNTPQVGSPFILEVLKNTSTGLYCIQRATYNGNVSYRRFSGDGGTTWSAWAKVLFTSDVILNQNASAQTTSNFWISGSGTMKNLYVDYGTVASGSPIASFSQNGGSIHLANGTGSSGNYIPVVRGVATGQNSWGIGLLGSGFDSHSQAAIVLRGVNTGNTGIVTSGKLFSVQNYTSEYLSIAYDGIVKIPALATATSGVSYTVFTDAGGTIGKRGMNNFTAQTSYNFNTANTVGEYAFVSNSGATGAPQTTSYSYYMGFGGGDIAGRGAQLAITRTDNNFYYRTIDSATTPFSNGGWIKLASQAWVLSQGYITAGSVINNQYTSGQTANMWINGIVRANCFVNDGYGYAIAAQSDYFGFFTNADFTDALSVKAKSLVLSSSYSTVAPVNGIYVEGGVKLNDLTGTGVRMVTTDADGNLSSATIPGSISYGTPTVTCLTSGCTATLASGKDNGGIINVSNNTGSIISSVIVRVTFGTPFPVGAVAYVHGDASETHLTYATNLGSNTAFDFKIVNGLFGGADADYIYQVQGW